MSIYACILVNFYGFHVGKYTSPMDPSWVGEGVSHQPVLLVVGWTFWGVVDLSRSQRRPGP